MGGFSHDAGHPLAMMAGWRGSPHFGPFHVRRFVFAGAGFWLFSAARPVPCRAQREGTLAAGLPCLAMSRIRAVPNARP